MQNRGVPKAPLKIDAAHARRYLVARHLLSPPRALPPSPASVIAVARRFGSLQVDPLAVTGAKNHDLVLAARIAGHDPAWVDQLAYGAPDERLLFEALNKSLNLLPIEELPFHRAAWEARRHLSISAELLTAHARVKKAVLARFAREGALPAAAFATKGEAKVTWGWGKATVTKAVLEALFFTGHIAVAGRSGNVKTYHLTEALYPASLLAKKVRVDEARRHRVLSRHRAVGLLGTSGSPELWLGTGTAVERRAAMARLYEDGALRAVEVEGLPDVRYLPAEDLPILDATRRKTRRSKPKVTLLAPLDPFMWDRHLIERLFGFAYRWEVYTPKAKRKHGYYTLPILFGDALVGRIEPVMDRANDRLRIDYLSVEPAFSPRTVGFREALDEAIDAHAAMVRARQVDWSKRALKPVSTGK